MKILKALTLIIVVSSLVFLIAGCDKANTNSETPDKTTTPVVSVTAQSPSNTPYGPTATPNDIDKVCGYKFTYDGDVELYEEKIEMFIDARTFYSVAYFDLEQTDNFTISYRLNFLPDTNYMQAGLYIKISNDVWGKFMRSYADGVKIDFYGTDGSLWNFEEGKSGSVVDPNATSESIFMKMESKDNIIKFYSSADGDSWTLLGTCTRLLSGDFEIGFSGATFTSGVNFDAVVDQIKIEYIE